MAWQRKIPFGYGMENGLTVIRPGEAEAVRRIFDRYLEGESYLSIAGRMTESGVRYHADAREWNKHMIKRILENVRYMGADGWPAIVPPEVFEKAARLRESKTDGRRASGLRRGGQAQDDMRHMRCPVPG